MIDRTNKYEKINISISTRILLYFTMLFVIVILVIILPVTNYYRRESEKNLKELGLNTLQSIDDRLNTVINEYKVLSNITLLKRGFQSDLQNESDVVRANAISNALLTILTNGSYTSNMLFYYNNKSYFETILGAQYTFNVDHLNINKWKRSNKNSKHDIEYSEMFQELFLITNPAGDYITFVRAINRLDDFSFLGLALFNIEKNNLESFLFHDFNYTKFIILDNQNKVIMQSSDLLDEDLKYAADITNDLNDFKIVNTKSGWLTFSKCQSKFFDWTLISITDLANKDRYPYLNIILMGLLLVLVIFFLCDLYISVNIIKPLSKIKKNMILVENGTFIPVKIKPTYFTSEITQLQNFFNKMILEIELLTKNIKVKEKIKRKNELLLLQEQIKPHFLYNTLDSISALNLIGDNNLAYELTTALSGFYRTSLSVANFLVTVETELECIKDYIKILNIRFKNKFDMEFDIEDDILQLRIPKLILQPLVENAINHGMRSKEGKGLLSISGRLKEDIIILSVEDNGVGIPQEKITEILKGRSAKSNSFGIYNTIEKLTLYGFEGACQIESKLSQYTKITIKIPREKHGEKNENQGDAGRR